MASYPGSLVTFTNHVDFTETILAAHVNGLQDEVTNIESTLGVNPQISDWTSATYSSGFSGSYTWPSLSARLKNLEQGLIGYGGFTPHPFLLAGM
jgi:hypothetical protein